ncbi:MAG: hypothetical protein AAB455_00590 [Patescibacteria group bacterium]
MNQSKQLLAAGLLALTASVGLVNSVSAQLPSADTRQNIRDTKSMTVKERIKEFGDRLALRLNASLDRAENLRLRVVDRVGQFQDPKFDKALVDAKLKEAADAIAAGKVKVATIAAEVAKAQAAANPTTALADLRTTVKGIIKDVRTAHQKVVEAIIMIKSAYPSTGSGQATTTTP